MGQTNDYCPCIFCLKIVRLCKKQLTKKTVEEIILYTWGSNKI